MRIKVLGPLQILSSFPLRVRVGGSLTRAARTATASRSRCAVPSSVHPALHKEARRPREGRGFAQGHWRRT